MDKKKEEDALKEIVQQFLNLKTKEDLALFFKLKLKVFTYILYGLPDSEKYKEFIIKKRNGKTRIIQAPLRKIKSFQKILSIVLSEIYSGKNCVHGFIKEKNIVSNAKIHCKKRFVLNFDIKNFFPSINYGRVYGLFLSKPFNFDSEVAKILAKICCFNGFLPQGAPTSPVISNYLCYKLDNQLLSLSLDEKCFYTRYADDISISTNLKKFPKKIIVVKPDDGDGVKLSDEMNAIITGNGFEINHEKTRLQTKYERQVVTGLIVNKNPNVSRKFVRKVRSQIRSWEKHGYENANKEYFEKYDKKNRKPGKALPEFSSIVKGNLSFIGMVKGIKNKTYLTLRKRLSKLKPELFEDYMEDITSKGTFKIYTEGKTDIKHIKAALAYFKSVNLFKELDLEFKETHIKKAGSPELMDLMESLKRAEIKDGPHLFVFDRDEPPVIKSVIEDGKDYKNHGKGIFSLALPIPIHRKEEDGICIELLYKDEDIKRFNENGKRLFLSNEFNHTNGRHVTEEELNCTDRNKYSVKLGIKIIDDQVFTKDGLNVALPKNDFAENILLNKKGFENMDFNGFKPLFDLIKSISLS